MLYQVITYSSFTILGFILGIIFGRVYEAKFGGKKMRTLTKLYRDIQTRNNDIRAELEYVYTMTPREFEEFTKELRQDS